MKPDSGWYASSFSFSSHQFEKLFSDQEISSLILDTGYNYEYEGDTSKDQLR
jgi:hypothetical protein